MATGSVVSTYDEFIERQSPWSDKFHWTKAERHPAFARSGWCPFCSAPAALSAELNHESPPYDEDDPCTSRSYSIKFWRCRDCGWWDLYFDETTGEDSVDPWYGQETYCHGIIKVFPAAEESAPLAALQHAIRKRPALIHEIHPRKMEELCAGVLSDYYGPCEVTLCG